jgi:type VI secretion system secreted protein VgrG
VLIGGRPAACVGDTLLCVGPPDVITNGALVVLIGGRPAARLGSATAHGGSVVLGMVTVLIGDGAAAGLAGLEGIVSPETIALISLSPTLKANLITLMQQGWTIQQGAPGGGTFADRTTHTITIDPNQMNNPLACTQSLAHESGHAMYQLEPEIPQGNLSRDDYVNQNVQRHLRDEGEATLTNAEVRREILNNGGPDIGIAGTHQNEYDNAYQNYQQNGDRQAARDQIGNIFGHGEHPSNSTGEDYASYYGHHYQNNYH